MDPNSDTGWDIGDMVGDNRKKIKCKFCHVVTTRGITRLKQHISHIYGEVEACKKAPKEISVILRKHLLKSKIAREIMKKRKETAIMAIREESRHIHDVDTESSSENDDEQGSRYANREYLSQMEKKQLRNAMKENRKQAVDEEERMRYDDGHTGGTSRGQTSGMKRGIFSRSSVREGTKKFSSGVDPFMFPSKQKTLKQFYAPKKFKAVAEMMIDMLLELAEAEKKDAGTSAPEVATGVVTEASSRGLELPSHSSSSPIRPLSPSSGLPLPAPEAIIELLDSETELWDLAVPSSGDLGLEEAQGESAETSSKRLVPSGSTPPPKRARLELPCLFTTSDPEGSADLVLHQLSKAQAPGDSDFLQSLPHSSQRAKLALCLAQASSILAAGFGKEDPSARDLAFQELNERATNARTALERATSRIYALMTENGVLLRQCEVAEEKLEDVQSKLCEARSVLEGRAVRAEEELARTVQRMASREREFQDELARRLATERERKLGELLATAEGLAVLDQYRVKLFERYPHTKLFLKDACPIGMYYVKQTIGACEAIAEEAKTPVRYEPSAVLGKINRTLPLWKGDPREPIDYPWWQPITEGLISSLGSGGADPPAPVDPSSAPGPSNAPETSGGSSSSAPIAPSDPVGPSAHRSTSS